MQQLLVGLDVGSTTVKAVVVDAATDAMLWQDYQRHETRQPEKVLEFLQRMEKESGISQQNTRVCSGRLPFFLGDFNRVLPAATGAASRAAPRFGARFELLPASRLARKRSEDIID